MSTAVWIVIGVIAVAVVIGVAWYIPQLRRTRNLRQRYGPEYDRTVHLNGTRREAEAELQRREQRVSQLQIRPLADEDRTRFAEDWRRVQSRFVDDPQGAVADADTLIGEVMQQRGYPVGDFEQQAADVSVDHPDVVTNYREAHRLATLSTQGHASTEEQRQSMVHFRSLFDGLLGEPEFAPRRGTDRETVQARAS